MHARRMRIFDVGCVIPTRALESVETEGVLMGGCVAVTPSTMKTTGLCRPEEQVDFFYVACIKWRSVFGRETRGDRGVCLYVIRDSRCVLHRRAMRASCKDGRGGGGDQRLDESKVMESRQKSNPLEALYVQRSRVAGRPVRCCCVVLLFSFLCVFLLFLTKHHTPQLSSFSACTLC